MRCGAKTEESRTTVMEIILHNFKGYEVGVIYGTAKQNEEITVSCVIKVNKICRIFSVSAKVYD